MFSFFSSSKKGIMSLSMAEVVGMAVAAILILVLIAIFLPSMKTANKSISNFENQCGGTIGLECACTLDSGDVGNKEAKCPSGTIKQYRSPDCPKSCTVNNVDSKLQESIVKYELAVKDLPKEQKEFAQNEYFGVCCVGISS